MAHDASNNNPVKESAMALVGIVLLFVMIGAIAVSAWLRPAGEHAAAEQEPATEMAEQAAPEAAATTETAEANAEAATEQAAAEMPAAEATTETASEAMAEPAAPAEADAAPAADKSE
ncbi:hypothetical protein [Moraxella marmotae]|uniref:hypothetical protein n=1 Tax=Moraxella marmotae TaxID=3344520 RepID=UPI0035F43103